MPVIQGFDNFNHGDFTVPGGANYDEILGTPTKDTSIVHSSDPASLLINPSAASEWVRHTVADSPTLPWQGFWFRIETADEPASNVPVAQISAADGAGFRLEFQPSMDRFFTEILGGANFPTSGTYTFDTWVWVEMILDTSGETRSGYARMSGSDFTSQPATRAISASTGTAAGIGAPVSATYIARYSNHHWGVANSISDWMGEPAPLTATFMPVKRRGF